MGIFAEASRGAHFISLQVAAVFCELFHVVSLLFSSHKLQVHFRYMSRIFSTFHDKSSHEQEEFMTFSASAVW